MEGSTGPEYIAELILSPEGLSPVFMEAFIKKLEENEGLSDVFGPVFLALGTKMNACVPSSSDADKSWMRVYNVSDKWLISRPCCV